MSGTILLADDSLTIQKVVELTFADTNYRVVAVSSGDELLDRMGDANPDLIICDVIMPGKDGYDVCEEIKSNPDWLHLPVILLTGTFEPFDRDRAVAAGCSEIITKPFEAQKLVETVERLLGPAPAEAAGEVEDFIPETVPDDEPAELEDVSAADLPPVEVPPEAPPVDAAVDFGTKISDVDEAGTEGEGIEFTTSGFAEMEASGQEEGETADSADHDGLEFDMGGPQPEDLEETTPSAGPPSAPPVDVSAETVKIEIPPIAEMTPPPIEEEPVETTDDAESAPDEAETAEPAVAELPETNTEPFADVAEEPFEAVAAEEPTEEQPGEFKDEPSMADTSPVEAPADTGERGLSDDDVDRIARRVLELASDRLDQIAWEVLPDMAEIVVRQRVREIEAEAEAETPDTVQ
jgi:CheY-like chemotaxis protein